MSNERDLEELVLTKKDFSSCGWKAVLAEKAHKHYIEMFRAFSDAMKKAENENRPVHGKILWLLSVACSMIFSRKKPQSLNQPFEPWFQLEDNRGLIPDDLSKADIDFFAEVADTIDDPRLKARLADLVWPRRKGKEKVDYINMAIDAYREISLDPEAWHPWDECLERAIALAKSVGKGAENRLAEIESSILDAFRSGGEGLFCLNLADILKSHGLGENDSTMIAQRLESLGHEHGKKNSFLDASRYFGASAYWFSKSKDEAKSVEVKVAQAEILVKDATSQASSTNPNNMLMAGRYLNAIQIYRDIPGTERDKYRVDERIKKLRELQSRSNKESLSEMAHITSDPMDLSQLIDDSYNAVKGKGPIEALWTFVNRHSVNAEDLRKSATETLKVSPMLGLVPLETLSLDGRVIDRQPGGFCVSDDRIRWWMISVMYRNVINASIQAIIGPALESLLLEHRLREEFFVNLAERSPFVALTGQARLWGKALFAGYDHDFATALHILVPQLENVVRFWLKEREVDITVLKEDGTEPGGRSLNVLMEHSETEKIFGKDLKFEIQALFCDHYGWNLRNRIAHGDVGDQEFFSQHVVYAWWLMLRIVLISFWKNEQNSPESEDHKEKETPNDPA